MDTISAHNPDTNTNSDDIIVNDPNSAVSEPETVVSQSVKKQHRSSVWPVLLSLLAVLLLGVGAYFLFFDKKGDHAPSYYEDDSDDDDGDNNYSQMREVVNAVKDNCPMDLGELGSVINIDFDETDKAIVYTYSINENLLDVESMSVNRVKMKEYMQTIISNPNDDVRKLMEIIIEEKGKLRYIYIGASTGITARATLTADELKDALNTYVSPRQKVQANINATNLSVPIQVDEVTQLTGMKMEGDNVVYQYLIDESGDVDVSQLKVQQAEVKESLKEVVYNNSNRVEKQFIDLVIEAGMNICYRYYGDTSNDIVEVIFTNAELRANTR